MKKRTLFAVFMAFGIFWNATLHAQTRINPKASLSLSRLNNDPESFKTSARLGYSAGVDFRLGGRLHYGLGAHYHVMNQKLTEIDNGTPLPDPINGIVGIRAMQFPLSVGLSLVDSDVFKLRVQGGLMGYTRLGVTKNNLNLKKEDFRKNYWSTQAGLGLDLWLLTVDLRYEWGQTGIFADQPETKFSTVSLNVGLIFGE